MKKKDQKTYNLALEVIHGKLNIKEFSILIDKSYRQSRRIIKKIKESGMSGVRHGNFDKIPHNKTNKAITDDVKSLLENDYKDFNLTHFREMLTEKEGIEIGKNIIHRVANLHGLVKNPKRRTAKKSHKPRARLPHEGMLIQFDGSVHPWFNNIICDLIGGIDDATGKIVGLEFFHGETSLHCMKVMKEITLNYGIPDAYYLDGAGYFGKVDRDTETQIGRALEQIGSKALIAGSSQAKGKIERLWGTLQDRLVAELKYYQIETIEEANKFLKEEFIPKFNRQFSVPAREKGSHFKTCDEYDLDNIFCKKEKRKVNLSNSFSLHSEIYIIDEIENYRFRSININTHIDGSTSYDICSRLIKVKRASDNIVEMSSLSRRAA
jgi:hypothetical protein